MSMYLCIYMVGLTVAMMGIPQIIRLARAARIVDQPGLRKVHRRPTPRLGGVAIYLATLVAVAVAAIDTDLSRSFGANLDQLMVLFAAASLMFVTGLVDDLRGLRARVKLVMQVAASVAVCAAGVRIETLAFANLFSINLGWLSWPATVLWIVGITNAVNLIDGLDGLAGGIAAAACGVIAFVAASLGQSAIMVLMLAMMGGLCGFLFFNSHPAKIFMGDSGTYFIGFMLGSGSLMACEHSARCMGMAVALLALGVPVADLFFSVVRRLLQRRSIFAPDRGHIHHQLLEAGLPHGHAVLVVYAVTLVAAGLAVWMFHVRTANAVVIFASAWMVMLGLFTQAGAVRLRESVKVFRRNLHITGQARRDRRAFEEAQLRLRESADFDDWWQAACLAANDLGLRSLSLHVAGRGGNIRTLSWRREEDPEDVSGIMHVSAPIRDRRKNGRAWIDTDVYVNGSLELAGRRAALFDRLMEEQGLQSLPPAGSRRPSVRPRRETPREAASKLRNALHVRRKTPRAQTL